MNNTMNLTTNETKKVGLALLAMTALMVLALAPTLSFAGAAGTSAFDDVWLWMVDEIEGTLGRVITAAMIVVGIVGGVAKQSLIAFAVGVGGGVGLMNAPTVINSLFTATATHAETAAAVLPVLTNGLGM